MPAGHVDEVGVLQEVRVGTQQLQLDLMLKSRRSWLPYVRLPSLLNQRVGWGKGLPIPRLLPRARNYGTQGAGHRSALLAHVCSCIE